MPIDIGQLLEAHRAYILATVSEQDYESEQEYANARHAIGVVHDRATTKTLIDLVRQGLAPNGELKPTGQASAAPVAATAVKSRAIKPGSKRAKDRAAKALETKRKNAANKAGGGGQLSAEAPVSLATHLTPIAGGAE